MIVRLRAFAFLIALAAAAVAAGCGPQPLPAGFTAFCPSANTIAMVYPIPSATGVPGNLSGIEVASQGTLDGTSNAVLAANSGPSTVSFGSVVAVPNPAPTPSQSPSFSNPQYSFSPATQTLASGTSYSVYYNDSSGVCTSVFLGTFITK